MKSSTCNLNIINYLHYITKKLYNLKCQPVVIALKEYFSIQHKQIDGPSFSIARARIMQLIPNLMCQFDFSSFEISFNLLISSPSIVIFKSSNQTLPLPVNMALIANVLFFLSSIFTVTSYFFHSVVPVI